MALNIAIQLIEDSVGMNFENIMLLLVALGGLIFYAKDFKIGVILHMVGFGCCFMLFYSLGLPYQRALVSFFLMFVILCITLYAISKTAPAYEGFI